MSTVQTIHLGVFILYFGYKEASRNHQQAFHEDIWGDLLLQDNEGDQDGHDHASLVDQSDG